LSGDPRRFFILISFYYLPGALLSSAGSWYNLNVSGLYWKKKSRPMYDLGLGGAGAGEAAAGESIASAAV
jgi:hypothetical protein